MSAKHEPSAAGVTSEELLRRYQQADLAAFSTFYARHEALIFHFLVARLRSVPDAEEAFQETFLRIHRSILRYDPGQSALTWVLTIARNVATDRLRQVRSRGIEISSEHEPEPVSARSSAVAVVEARETLEKLVAKLSAEEAEILRLRLVEEDSYEAIAAARDLKEDGVRQKVSRLLRKLRTP